MNTISLESPRHPPAAGNCPSSGALAISTSCAAFRTAMLVFGQRLAQGDLPEAGWERLLATALGALVSFLIVTVVGAPPSKAGHSTPVDGSGTPMFFRPDLHTYIDVTTRTASGVTST